MMTGKAIIIGLDSAVPWLIKKFADEGTLPNLKKLIDEGVFGEGLCSFPSLTGTNWTSIVTGAWPGTLGVAHMWTHYPGEPLNRVRSSFLSTTASAEPLWKTGEKIGKKSILMKYPCTVPSNIENGIQIEGTGSPWYGLNPFEISPCKCFSTQHYPGAQRIEFKKAENWTNLPKSQSTPVESIIILKSKSTESSVKYHLLLIDSKGNGYDEVLITSSRDAEKIKARLSKDSWSPWLKEEFNARIPLYIKYREDSKTVYEDTPLKKVEGTFRFKLIETSPDSERFKLYQTQICPTKGFTWPDSVAEELLESVGPFQEHIGPNAVFNNWIDDETFLEELEYQAWWLGKASSVLMSRHDWDLYFLQWHGPNHAQHTFWGGIDPISPWYKESTENIYWECFRRFYGAADQMIGDVLRHADDETLVVVTADHGHVPYVYGAAMISNALVKGGLLVYDDKGAVDWKKTRAYPLPAYIYVNLKGRDPEGIVEPGAEYEKIQNKVISILYSIRDPKGFCPVAFALKREEAEMIGLHGERVGDVIYGNNAGYTSILENSEDLQQFKFVKGDISVTDDWGDREGQLPANTSIHGSNLPSSKLGLGTIRVPLIMSGPQVKKGYELKRLFSLVDIAPTVSYVIDMPFPAQSEGAIIHEALL